MGKVWVLNDNGKKEPVSFLVDGYVPEPETQCINFMDFISMGIHA